MELAVIAAILEGIGKVAAIINGIYQLYQNIDEFSNTPDWFKNPNGLQKQQFNRQLEEIKIGRQQVLDACADVQGAISQLDKTIFRATMADKLGDADQAEQAHENWLITGDAIQRGHALNESAGALADLLAFSSTGAYPNVSLVVPLLEVLFTRIMILSQADPQFIASSVARRPIEDSIKLIRSTANDLEAHILARNQIKRTSTRHVKVERVEGGGRVKTVVITISFGYRNISGTAAYSNSISYEAYESAEYESTVELYGAQASAARAVGLAEDLRRAQIEAMRNTADLAEKVLRGEEIQRIQRIIGRKLTVIERSEFRVLRRSADFRRSTMEIADKYFLDPTLPLQDEALRGFADELLNRKLTDNEEQALTTLARSFGAKAVLRTLLNHSDCVLRGC